jgi:hypothetical protein
MISIPKGMISRFWFPFGFPVIIALPARAKFSTPYCCSDSIPETVEENPFDLAVDCYN